MITAKEVLLFLTNHFQVNEESIKLDTDIYKDLGVDGDDFSELMEEFSKRFHVDLSSFLWYFHHNGEGFNIGALFIKPPNKRVDRIAITPEMLQEYANTKKWGIKYPKHCLPKRRYDIILTWIFLGIFILVILI